MNTVDITTTTRRLLARVRDVMAGEGSGQERLDSIVAVIGENLRTEVCSVYVRRPGDVLELFATRGLNPDSVHRTHLRVGEGLVGIIALEARPLALTDIQSHPQFAFRPQTGEEAYSSLGGVPILRTGRVIGVLAVQTRGARAFAEEEIELLATVAMVLAEMVAGGDLVDRDGLRPSETSIWFPVRLEGMRLSPGVAMGQAVIHAPRFQIRNVVAENPEAEQGRLRRAVADMHGAIDAMLGAENLPGEGEHREILATYRLIAADAGWIGRIEDAIASGLTAEAAVQRVQTDIRVRMGQITDEYLRERIHDLDDLANRLLQHLLAREPTAALDALPADMILVARTLGPAEVLDYDLRRLRGLILEQGGPTCHAAIVARALDIPVVGHVPGLMDRVDPDDLLIVDGDNGQVFIRPGEEVRDAFRENLIARDLRRRVWTQLRDLPGLSLDGEPVAIHINAGLLADLQHMEDWGADGVGLYRTEIPFMVRSEYPDVEAQRLLYGKVLERVGAKPVVFRTLDVGGDKNLPYWREAEEENPAMGWRAIRVTLDRPAMMMQQLRALIQAAAGRDLRVLFPMVSELAEYDAARALLDGELDRQRQRGGATPSRVLTGVMLEVPALAFQLGALLKRVDFISVGSNDLLQFLFASDRSNPRLADRYDTLSPVVLRFLGSLADRCRSVGVPLTVCGEMAGRPLECMALVGMGIRGVSVPPPAVGPIKAMIRSLQVAPLREYLETLLDPDRRSVRTNLQAYAQDHGILI